MHIAIVAPPVPGHYDPLRVLAAALERRGHRASFVHMPDAARLVPGFGFEAVGARTHGPGALARYADILARASRPTGFLAMIRATAAITSMLRQELPDALRRMRADAVVADSTEPAGGLVARDVGLPWATSVTGLPLLREPAVPPPFVDWPYGDDPASLHRNRVGYRIADWLQRPIARAAGTANPAASFSPDLQVAQCPPQLDFPRRALPPGFHYCGPWRAAAEAPPDLPAADGRPLIYCSLGSLQGDRPSRFAAMTEACARVGARALVATGGRLSDADAARLPGDPIVRAHWHQPSVLPHCRAAILHGGFNTVLDALAAGVPMLVAPIAFEQPGTAARVRHHGFGALLPKRLTADRIASALRALLADEGMTGRARAVADQMRTLGGIEEAADRIDAFVRRRVPA